MDRTSNTLLFEQMSNEFSGNLSDFRPEPYSKLEQRILDNPTASYWLKDAVRALHARDPFDAASDASALLAVVESRAALVQAEWAKKCGLRP